MTTMSSASPATVAEPVPTTVAEPASPTGKSSLSWFAALLISVNLLLAIAVVGALLWFGSLATAAQVLGGRPLVVDATTKSFGVAEPGQTVEVTFMLTNHGLDPIRVVGCRLTCDCQLVDSQPFVLESGQSRPYQVTIDLPNEPQTIERPFTIHTNLPRQTKVEISVTGEVTKVVGEERG